MCVGLMGASTLERRREGVGQGVGVVDRGRGTLGPRVVGVQEERCCRRWCVAGLLWRGLGPPQEMGDGPRKTLSNGLRPFRSPLLPLCAYKHNTDLFIWQGYRCDARKRAKDVTEALLSSAAMNFRR